MLNNRSTSPNDYYAAQRKQREIKQILKLWDDFKRNDNSKHYDNVKFRRTIASIMGGTWKEERIRDIIRQRDENLGETDYVLPSDSPINMLRTRCITCYQEVQHETNPGT